MSRRWLQRWFGWARRPATWREAAAQIEDLLDAHRVEAAAQLARRAVTRWPDTGELWMLVADIDGSLGHTHSAIAAITRALELGSDDPSALVMFADLHLDIAEFERAREIAVEAMSRLPAGRDAAAFARRAAMASDYLGQTSRADELFERAHSMDPELHPVPPRWSEREFEEEVRAAVERLPPAILQGLGALDIQVADWARPELFPEYEEPLPATTLGVCSGPVRDQADIADPLYPAIPPTIFVFQRCHEHQFPVVERLRDQIGVTVFHEVGHYLGLDEDEVDERGLG